MKRFVDLFKKVIKYRKVSSSEDLKEIIAEAEDEGVISEEEESLMDRVLKIEDIWRAFGNRRKVGDAAYIE